jgi:hypothetical protein
LGEKGTQQISLNPTDQHPVAILSGDVLASFGRKE